MSELKLEGSCLCGEVAYSVQYNISEQTPRFYHCHCKRCRKASGTGHASLIIIGHCSLQWLKGEALLSRYKVPEAERFATCFCKKCGSALPRYDEQTGRAVIPAGSLDHDIDLRPQARIFWDSRTEWSCSDNIPAYAEYPE
ncbi:MAG: GFA family protein [Gammaproteobacteria bacterium]|nr:GFA family protein [Gammaproteobacteria bacterium]